MTCAIIFIKTTIKQSLNGQVGQRTGFNNGQHKYSKIQIKSA